MSTNILADGTLQHEQLSDNQLLSRARSGDQQAFGVLCLRYNGMLKQKIFSIVRHQEDTEDVLQDTFLNVYIHLHAFRETCKFSTWLTKIGINVSLMLLRKRKKLWESANNEFETLELRDPAPDPEQEYMTDQTSLTLQKAIEKLPPRTRSVMDLYYRKERRIKEAAAMLGITEATAKARMLRARRILRRSLKQQNPDTLNDKRLERSPENSEELYVFANKNRPRAQNHLTARVSDSVALVQSEYPSLFTP
jgi:RNA polymerase sigma-70 factor, ECF subfamily